MRDLTQHEQAMLHQLRAGGGRPGNGVLRRSSCQFLLDYGWWYEPVSLPKDVAKGNPNECYQNALLLALERDELVYVEGFAAGPGGLRIHHAWVTDGKGRAFDPTWNELGVVYVGVPFNAGWVSLRGLTNKGVGSVIDDLEDGFPLLDDLGDRPDEWMEPRGMGFIKVTRH
jgi:hypothetical protein